MVDRNLFQSKLLRHSHLEEASEAGLGAVASEADAGVALVAAVEEGGSMTDRLEIEDLLEAAEEEVLASAAGEALEEEEIEASVVVVTEVLRLVISEEEEAILTKRTLWAAGERDGRVEVQADHPCRTVDTSSKEVHPAETEARLMEEVLSKCLGREAVTQVEVEDTTGVTKSLLDMMLVRGQPLTQLGLAPFLQVQASSPFTLPIRQFGKKERPVIIVDVYQRCRYV